MRVGGWGDLDLIDTAYIYITSTCCAYVEEGV